MHRADPSVCSTLWSSNYEVYDRLTPAYREFLSGLTATHDAYRFREQSRANGFKLREEPRGSPDNVGGEFKAVHPLIRTNPVTGLQSIYANVTFTTRINELSFDESRSVLNYLFRLQHESHDAHVKYHWGKHDLAIWDNSSVNQ